MDTTIELITGQEVLDSLGIPTVESRSHLIYFSSALMVS